MPSFGRSPTLQRAGKRRLAIRPGARATERPDLPQPRWPDSSILTPTAAKERGSPSRAPSFIRRMSCCSSAGPATSDKSYEMLDRLVQTLVESKNEAADDVLLGGAVLGSEPEKTVRAGRRCCAGGPCALERGRRRVRCLPESLQARVLTRFDTSMRLARVRNEADDRQVRLPGD